MVPIHGKPGDAGRVHPYVGCARPKARSATVAFSAVPLVLCMLGVSAVPVWAGQAKVDQASPTPMPADSASPHSAIDPASPNVVAADPAAGASPAWRDKQISDWTDADARQVLADSPWAKSVIPTSDKPLEKNPSQPQTRKRFGIGGFGIGGSRRNTASNAGDGGGSGSTSSSSSSSSSSSGSGATPATLRLRWESALPIREAELKSHDTGALAVDEDHYAIAVYGVPGKMVKDDSKKFAEELKAQATIKREAKADLKPSSVTVRVREDGPVILYLFPRTEEITWRDHLLEFDAQIGPLKVKQSFAADDMRFHGTLEL